MLREAAHDSCQPSARLQGEELYDTDDHGELTEMKESGAFQIIAGPVQDIPFIAFKGRQLMITDMKWLA